jgi:long-chain fatty acid transport protein
MRLSKPLAVLSVLLISTTIPAISNATNGAWLIGFGAKSRAMGGTGVAYNMGGMAAAFNPATMIDSGNRFDIGAELFIPPRAVTHQSGILGYTDEESNENLFLIPSMGGTWQWKEDMVLGFAFIGAGLKTEYNQTANSDSCQRVNAGAVPGYTACPPTVFDPNITITPGTEAGVQLMQAQFIPSIAWKINKTHTLGASIVLAGQYFRAEGLEAFADLGFTSGTDPISSDWDNSWGAGVRVGWLGKFDDDRFNVGVNYSSRVYMSEFERYKNLFAEQGDFDIPENYALGLSYKVKPNIAVAFDVQRINWSDVASIGNPGPAVDQAITGNLFPLCPGTSDKEPCKLGGDLGLGFGWQDQTVYKIGVDWMYSEKLNLRAGWNYGETPIPADQVLFNMLAPATPEHHLTLGGGYNFTENMILDVNLMIAFLETIKGPTAFGPGGANVTGTNASIAMGQYGIGAMFGMKF